MQIFRGSNVFESEIKLEITSRPHPELNFAEFVLLNDNLFQV